ncbi:MAG TPA: DUF3995 domain-containing protein [Pyrinomonadaceae bacterium]|jgi:hypothetical protein|nr:DUF3995 domain-containing protein [Pyrinomonadaceae bacterium]
MIKILAILLAVIFTSIALLHLYWALGGSTSGMAAVPTVGGRQTFTPSAFGTVMVAVAFVLATLVVLGQAGFLGAFIPHWIFRVGTFGIAIIFLARAIGEFKLVGFFKQASDSSFAYWDTWFYSPLCLAVAIIAFIVAFKDS